MPSSDQGPNRRLSDAEALMWSLESEPALRSTFIGVTFLDRAPDFERFRSRVSEAVATTAALNHRVSAPTIDRRSLHWEPDPGFDLDFHVRRLAVPPPGTRRQVLDLAALLSQDPLDRTRPLWQFTVVEGLESGEAVLLSKMDHVLSDGVGAIRMSTAFLDLSADGGGPEGRSARPPDPPTPAGDGGIRSDGGDGGDGGGDTHPGGVLGAMGTLGSLLTSNLGLAASAATAIFDALRQPQQLPRQAQDTVNMARSLARQVAVIDPAHSPLWSGRHSLARQFEILSVDLETVTATAHSLGGTVNDVFVTAVAGAAGGYHQDRGADVADLRMSMPVSTRSNRSVGGNFWSPTRVLVPAAKLDPLSRFALVRERLDRTKTEPSLGLAGTLAGLARTLPAPLMVSLARQQVRTVDFACSNVRGAPFDLWVAGARVLANHPMGPTGGTAFNATVLSYKGSFDVGLNVDARAVEDPGDLRDRIVEGFAELAAAAGV